MSKIEPREVDVWDEAEDVINQLIEAGWLSEIEEATDCFRGFAYGLSPSGEAWAFLIDAVGVEVPDQSGTRASLELTIRDSMKNSQDIKILGCVAWPGGYLYIRQGKPDFELDKDIVEQLLQDLSGFSPTLVWSRPVPPAAKVKPRFGNVTEVLETLTVRSNRFQVASVVKLEQLTDLGADWKIQEQVALAEPKFLSVRGQLSVFGSQSESIRLDIRHENRWGEDCASFLRMQFPVYEPHLFVFDDGWVVRLVDEGKRVNDIELHRSALAVQYALGGVVSEEAYFSLD